MRNTLSWIKCNLCGRRMATIKCRLGKTTMELCPYCVTALSMPGGPCSHRAKARTRRRLDLDEDLLSKLGS
ncbi:MAG: hypothetical protein GSR84_02105 [Desulfurococcales archaeon]|nr:hypothetical protein [Desulfurococcales archaeon]